jgi:transcriptional regulator with XRE-family HTH domain
MDREWVPYEELRAGLARAIRRLRGERGISQERLAALSGVHRVYMGDVENAKRNVGLENLTGIARALGVPLSRLIAEAEEEALKRQG